ncbi:MAG: protein-L-isoaspartate(D-aspartate) O-methyltransferase [Candidatus Aureabacteria bacterium]|nr:protein-L-isoaspartate(D-aspartate) O-methyltransferase [Candidatus Auribacterota bacterium]
MDYFFRYLVGVTILVVISFCGCEGNKHHFDKGSYAMKREDMVKNQIEVRGISDKTVLEALRKVPRHMFVPVESQDYAYNDHPLPIGFDQTISQPYIVALMTELALPKKSHKVLEIGTGSGYQAAVLAEIVGHVYTIEIVSDLGKRSEKKLKELGYTNIHMRIGNGYLGWPEEAPFDAIIVTAAPEEIPVALIDQLKMNAKLVIPVGKVFQDLMVITKTKDGIKKESIIPVRFVPMVGDEK